MNDKNLTLGLIAVILVLIVGLTYSIYQLHEVSEQSEQAIASVNSNADTSTPITVGVPEELPVEQKPESNSVDTKVIPWKLAKGDVTDTCTSPTFEGQVTLKGRYVWDTSYVNNQWVFEISPEQLKLLPLAELKLLDYYKDKAQFVLENASEALEEELKVATDWEPKEITITKFNQYCEGSAVLTVK